jgi:outer membrane lipase/esterase
MTNTKRADASGNRGTRACEGRDRKVGRWSPRRVANAVLLAGIAGMPAAAVAGGLDQFIGFGDSTMDSGYFRYSSTGGSPSFGGPGSAAALDAQITAVVAAGGSGDFMGPGVVDTIQLAAKFGLSALPSTAGGTNYANGSAQAVSTTAADNYLHGLYNNVPIVTQISNYLASVHNAANPNAVYMISFGGNDLIWLQLEGGSTPPAPYIAAQATALTASLTTLSRDGARTMLVLDVYAYAKLVGPGGTMTAANAVIVAQAASYSAQVWSGLHAAGVNFIPVNVEGLLRYVSQNPTPFGFIPSTVLASSPACGVTSGLVCAPAQLVAPNAEQTYLWSDVNHLTTAGQTLETDYMYNLLTAPSEISMLAETAVQGGLARAATIQGRSICPGNIEARAASIVGSAPGPTT